MNVSLDSRVHVMSATGVARVFRHHFLIRVISYQLTPRH